MGVLQRMGFSEYLFGPNTGLFSLEIGLKSYIYIYILIALALDESIIHQLCDLFRASGRRNVNASRGFPKDQFAPGPEGQLT